MAARLQEKLRNPRQAKNVPRIECVEDPALRQEQVTAAFPNKIRYNSEDVAHVVAQESVDAPEDATQLRSPRKHPMRRTSTRRARPSAHTTDAEQLQSSRDLVNVTDTKYRALSQAGQRKSARRGVTLSSYPSPPVPPSQSSNQRSNDGKPNTILPGVNIYVNDQSLPKRKKGGGVVYAERGKRLRTSLPTLTFDKVVTREPIEGVNAPRHQTSSAPSLELVGMYGSQSDGEAPHKFTPPNEHTTAWDHSKSGCDLGMPGVTRRRTRSSILSQPPPEDSLDMSINIPCNQNGGSWKTYNRTRGHDVRAAAQEADDLDVDFTLWGDPSAGDPDGDSF
jgi:hypothetical protein